MRFQRINRSDPDKVFAVCKNAYATSALTQGWPVCWAYNGTDDGLAVTKPAAAILPLLAGIVADTIAISGYGEVQVYGHNADAYVYGSTDVTAGNKLAGKDGQFYLVDSAATEVAAESGLVIAGQAYTTATAAQKKVFIRCM